MGLSSVAIIPDGNRRYAQKHSLQLSDAYSRGFAKVNDVLDWAGEFHLQEMTFWALSLENFEKRSKLELQVLFSLMAKNIREAMGSKKLLESNAAIKFFGKKELLPQGLLKEMSVLEEKTAGNKEFTLNVAVAYSGQDELLHASKLLAADVQEGRLTVDKINEKTFSSYLYYNHSPDLIIRTGNVQRLSGFLPYQSAYSEYYFSPKLWPEFERNDFAQAVDYYESTQRRFGK